MKKVYSETVIDHAKNTRNVGNLESVDGHASVTGPWGYTMDMWLKVRNDIVTEATFMTNGCGTTIAAGSMVTELARDKSVSQDLPLSRLMCKKHVGAGLRRNRFCKFG